MRLFSACGIALLLKFCVCGARAVWEGAVTAQQICVTQSSIYTHRRRLRIARLRGQNQLWLLCVWLHTHILRCSALATPRSRVQHLNRTIGSCGTSEGVGWRKHVTWRRRQPRHEQRQPTDSNVRCGRQTSVCDAYTLLSPCEADQAYFYWVLDNLNATTHSGGHGSGHGMSQDGHGNEQEPGGLSPATMIILIAVGILVASFPAAIRWCSERAKSPVDNAASRASLASEAMATRASTAEQDSAISLEKASADADKLRRFISGMLISGGWVCMVTEPGPP